MGHTAESAKGARSKMLGDMIRFGASAIFLTVTPDDGNSLRIQIFVQQETNEAPDPMLASNEDIKADFDLSIERRQIYPGFCAFDFQQITELMIQYILGWDRKAQASYDEGGVFGVLEAWSATIEEQGRKTLHSHWILYVKQWSELLNGLYSNVERKRQSAVAKLHAYVDSIMSTKLFGLDTISTIIQQSYKHDCIKRKPGMPELCSNQDLRNLRFAYGESSFKGDNIDVF